MWEVKCADLSLSPVYPAARGLVSGAWTVGIRGARDSSDTLLWELKPRMATSFLGLTFGVTPGGVSCMPGPVVPSLRSWPNFFLRALATRR